MKVLHINTSQNGGAALCVTRIFKAIKEQGIETKILFAQGEYVPEDLDGAIAKKDKITSLRSNWLVSRLRHLLMRIPYYFNAEKLQARIDAANIDNIYAHQPLSEYKNIINHPLVKWADIIHLHYVVDFIDYPSFFSQIKKPVVWTLHDKYPALGAIHFESEYIHPSKEFDKIDEQCRLIKRKALSKAKNINFVAISEMMRNRIETSTITKDYPVTLIHNGVDTNSFSPNDNHSEIISSFVASLEPETKIFLFSSYWIWTKLKGLDRTIDALEEVKENLKVKVALIVIGGIWGEDKVPTAKFPLLCTGLINKTEELSKIYSQVDYFINASMEESFCQAISEAMSCGCPVISTPTGVGPDIIHSFNGVLCKGYDSNALAEGISRAIDTQYNRSKIREYVIENYDYKKTSQEYITVYKRALGN